MREWVGGASREVFKAAEAEDDSAMWGSVEVSTAAAIGDVGLNDSGNHAPAGLGHHGQLAFWIRVVGAQRLPV